MYTRYCRRGVITGITGVIPCVNTSPAESGAHKAQKKHHISPAESGAHKAQKKHHTSPAESGAHKVQKKHQVLSVNIIILIFGWVKYYCQY